MKKITLQITILLITFYSWHGNAQYIDEGFEGAFPPTDWSIFNNGLGNDWTLNTSTSYVNSGVQSAKYTYNSSEPADTWLFSNSVTLTAGETVDWSFYVRDRSFTEKVKLTVGNAQDVASQTTVLIDLNTGTDISTSFEKKSGTYTATTAGDYYFAFNCYSDADEFELFIDDFLVETPPTCIAPSDVVATPTSTTEADFTWTANDTEMNWSYEYGLAGFTQGAGTSGTTTTESLSLSGLTPGETYDIYVRANCGGTDGDSTWTNVVSFTMPLPPPANDTFAGAIPITPSAAGTGCSTFTFIDSTGGDGTTDSGLDGSCNGTDTGLDRFYSWTATSDALIWSGGAGGPGIIIRDSSGTEITCEQTLSSDVTLSGWAINDDLIIQVYDFGTADVDTSFCLEEFTLPTAPLCAESLIPTDGTTDLVVTGGEITLTWSAPSSGETPTGYNVWFGTTSGSLTNVGSTDGSTFTADITGIDYSTVYYWSIVPTNGASPAVNCSELTFETEAAPPAPANDDCSTATLVDGALPYNNVGDASTATNNSGFISSCGFGMNDGVWYTFTPIIGGTVDIALTGVTGWDAELAIYSGSCGVFTCVDSADVGGTGGDESLTGVSVVAGTQYWINLGHFSSSTNSLEGPYTIDISSSDGTALSVENNKIDGFSIYPNPVNDRLQLNALDNINDISVYNLLGQVVYRMQPNVLTTEVDMTNLPSGMYVVKVQVGDQLGSYKIIKE